MHIGARPDFRRLDQVTRSGWKEVGVGSQREGMEEDKRVGRGCASDLVGRKISDHRGDGSCSIESWGHIIVARRRSG
eukprot:1953721-Pyramimonas_sp.AAC.1